MALSRRRFVAAGAALAVVLLGLSFGVAWPGYNALTSSIVSGAVRTQFFGINFALVNLGIGVGGVVSGFLTDVDRPATFTAIFLVVDCASGSLGSFSVSTPLEKSALTFSASTPSGTRMERWNEP